MTGGPDQTVEGAFEDQAGGLEVVVGNAEVSEGHDASGGETPPIVVGLRNIRGLVKTDARFAPARSSGPVEVDEKRVEAHPVEGSRLA